MIPEKSMFPEKYNTEYELKTVVDSLYSFIIKEIKPYDKDDIDTYNWQNGEGVIELDNSDNWPDSGYVTIYLKENYGEAKYRAALFHYNGKKNNQLKNVTILDGQTIIYFPIGSIAIQNVVAENHNYNKDAILNIEKYVGNRKTNDQSTIEWFTNFYVSNIRKPKPWFFVYPNVLLTNEYITIKDSTTRIRPGFSPELDNTVQWVFQCIQDSFKLIVSLDIDTKEYVFNIYNNEKLIKTERKKTWNKEIKYKFKNSGVYSLSLYVKNEFGSDRILLKDIIRVIDQSPVRIDIRIAGDGKEDANGWSLRRCKSETEQIQVIAEPDLSNNSNIEIKEYIWDVPGISGELIPKTSYINISFESGGLYHIGLKAIAENGSWVGNYIPNAIDVMEKPSVWIGYINTVSSNFNINEYSIRSNSWKLNHPTFNFGYDFLIDDTKISFKDDKGFHGISGSDDSYILWSKSVNEINIAKYKSVENIILKENALNTRKLYNWYTLYIPYYDTGKIFIFGGLVDLSDMEIMDQSIRYYDITNKTIMSKINSGYINSDISLDSFKNAKEIKLNPNNKPCKWKSTSYIDKGYILRNSKNNYLEDFFEFNPISLSESSETEFPSFITINGPLPFSKTELGMNALKNGIYINSNRGDLYKYDPIVKVWTTLTSGQIESYSSNFYNNNPDSRNENAILVSASHEDSKEAYNSSLYFSYDYSYDAFGRFNIDNLSFQKLQQRPEYITDVGTKQWDMILF